MSEPNPVCEKCNDTHMMNVRFESGDVRKVMCTRCPTPCEACRKGKTGAYCETTPCPCVCHGAKHDAPPLLDIVFDSNRERVAWEIFRLNQGIVASTWFSAKAAFERADAFIAEAETQRGTVKT